MFRPVPGATVGRRYRLQSVIGAGGMGEIWRAHDVELERPCAVKFILGHLATDEGVRARLLREAKAAARLRSAHAVHVLGAGEHEGAMYLAMELLEGEPLSARLARSELLSPSETLTLLSQVTHALEKAHAAGIVHRDLKPDNIWLCADHELFVKVLDFGVAKTQLSFASKHTATGALVGTPHYMSPEQAMAEREVDHRSDLWSLAIISAECLTGKRPFEANGIAPLLLKLVSQAPPPLAQLGAHLPASLEAWWQRALQRDPERRFQSASELVDALRRGFEDAAGRADSLPATELAPLPSVISPRAQTAHDPTRGGGSLGSLQSMSPFSRTHVTPLTARRWWRLLVGGGAAAVLAAGGWLALHGQGELAASLSDAGGSAAAATQLTQPRAELAPAPLAPIAATSPAVTSPQGTARQPTPGDATQEALPQHALPEGARPAMIRPLLSPLPPMEANPWARTATSETSAGDPKIAKKVAKAPASPPVSLGRTAAQARVVTSPPKPTVAKPAATKTPVAEVKPAAATSAAPTATTPAGPTRNDAPPAAPSEKRDLGF